tara:strand:+ start:11642 stop:11950 length:309 start_codon:yes stop_codon:yes gene_type:complete
MTMKNLQTEAQKNLKRIDDKIENSRVKIQQDMEEIQIESSRLKNFISEDLEQADRVGSAIYYRTESINEELQRIQILKVERDYMMWMVTDAWEKDQKEEVSK